MSPQDLYHNLITLASTAVIGDKRIGTDLRVIGDDRSFGRNSAPASHIRRSDRKSADDALSAVFLNTLDTPLGLFFAVTRGEDLVAYLNVVAVDSSEGLILGDKNIPVVTLFNSDKSKSALRTREYAICTFKMATSVTAKALVRDDLQLQAIRISNSATLDSREQIPAPLILVTALMGVSFSKFIKILFRIFLHNILILSDLTATIPVSVRKKRKTEVAFRFLLLKQL